MSFPLSQQHLVWWQDEGGGQDDSVNPAAPRGSIGRYHLLKPSSIVAIFVLLNFFGNLPTTLADIRISSAIISPPQMDEDSSFSFAGGDDAKFGSTKDETASVIVDSLVTQQQYDLAPKPAIGADEADSRRYNIDLVSASKFSASAGDNYLQKNDKVAREGLLYGKGKEEHFETDNAVTDNVRSSTSIALFLSLVNFKRMII